jgi:hypothetical protein
MPSLAPLRIIEKFADVVFFGFRHFVGIFSYVYLKNFFGFSE